MFEKVKSIASSKTARRVGHFAHGGFCTFIGTASATMGYICTACGIVACCNDRKVTKDYALTTVIGGGLLYSGYLMMKDGIEEVGDTIIDIVCKPDSEPQEPGITSEDA